MDMEQEQEVEHDLTQDAGQENPSYTTIEAQLGEMSTRVENIYLAEDARFDQMINLMQ